MNFSLLRARPRWYIPNLVRFGLWAKVRERLDNELRFLRLWPKLATPLSVIFGNLKRGVFWRACYCYFERSRLRSFKEEESLFKASQTLDNPWSVVGWQLSHKGGLISEVTPNNPGLISWYSLKVSWAVWMQGHFSSYHCEIIQKGLGR